MLLLPLIALATQDPLVDHLLAILLCVARKQQSRAKLELLLMDCDRYRFLSRRVRIEQASSECAMQLIS